MCAGVDVMYSIQYYKSKRVKPTLDEPNYLSDNRKLNCIKRRRYLRQKDLIDKCWNIKSLTIDLNDIENIIYDENLNHLLSLYARANRLRNNGIEHITILNNSRVNLLYIYETLNCEWMINSEEISYSDQFGFQKVKS